MAIDSPNVLRIGKQRQRTAAALEPAIRQPRQTLSHCRSGSIGESHQLSAHAQDSYGEESWLPKNTQAL